MVKGPKEGFRNGLKKDLRKGRDDPLHVCGNGDVISPRNQRRMELRR
jgi:hypothetical protein